MQKHNKNKNNGQQQMKTMQFYKGKIIYKLTTSQPITTIITTNGYGGNNITKNG